MSCTPKGIMQMLASTNTDLNGKNVTVVGRSNIVGKPVAILCLQQNATVTMCHSRTKDLNAKLSDADVIIVAVGIPKFCLLYTSPSPRDRLLSRMPSSA